MNNPHEIEPNTQYSEPIAHLDTLASIGPDYNTENLVLDGNKIQFSHIRQRVSTDLLKSRMDAILNISDNYNDMLPDAWNRREQIEAKIENIDYVQVKKITDGHLQHQIELLSDRIINSGISSVAIEAAHVYLYESLDDTMLRNSILLQSESGAMLSSILNKAGIEVRQMVFIDNYNENNESNGNDNSLEPNHLLDVVNSAHYYPELLFWEAGMVDLAKEIISFMYQRQDLVLIKEGEDTNNRQNQKNSNYMLQRKNIELYRASDDMVSCAMLDAALTILKFKYIGEAVVNVLPKRATNAQNFSYNNQQRKMREIVREHLGVHTLPIFNLFTSNENLNNVAAGAHNAFRKDSKNYLS